MKIRPAWLILLLLFFIDPYLAVFADSPASTRVLVRKADRTMIILQNDKPVSTFKITLGRNPVGPKERQGDSKTPEGVYRIDGRNQRSKFYRALHISYPNEKDRKGAEKSHVNLGGDIMIHGLKNGLGWLGGFHQLLDWTDGCIAVSNSEMDEVWKLVPIGTEIEIVP